MRAGEYIRSLRSPVFTGAIQISILLTYLPKLIISEKKIVRLCNKFIFNAHISDTLINRNVLSIFTINEFQTGRLMYKVMNYLALSHSVLMFNFRTGIHSHYARKCDNLHVSYSRTKLRSSSILILGVKVWITIGDEIRHVHTFCSLKKI